MKKLILSLLILCTSFIGFSQVKKPSNTFDKGKFSVSAGANFGVTNLFVIYSLNGTVGYFAKKNFLTGLIVTQTFEGNLNTTYYLSNSVGVFGKYFFGNYKIKPWASASIDYKSIKLEMENINGFVVPLGIGIDIALTKRLSFELGFYKDLNLMANPKNSFVYPIRLWTNFFIYYKILIYSTLIELIELILTD